MELSKKDISAIGMLFNSLTRAVTDTLSSDFGASATKSFKLTVEEVKEFAPQEIKATTPLVHKVTYSLYGKVRPLLLFIPKDFVAALSDILTGGDGSNVDGSNLTEVQINTYTGLFSSISKNMELTFRDLYNDGIEISPEENVIEESDGQYEAVFDSTPLNLAVIYTLSFGSKRKFPIVLACGRDALLRNMRFLKLISEDISPSVLDFSQIARISDIKVKLYVELGNTKIPLKTALELDNDSIIELDALANSDVSVYADNIEVAKAQIVAVEDNYGIKITEIIALEDAKQK